eukprot:scaffold41444_cov31-Tisochrysis_lutea.AAC.1
MVQQGSVIVAGAPRNSGQIQIRGARLVAVAHLCYYFACVARQPADIASAGVLTQCKVKVCTTLGNV